MSERNLVTAGHYLTFGLDEESFALEISQVREVLDYTAVTKVPRTPDFLRGVINLRGNVLPVIDLKLSLGMTATQCTKNTCIVIMEVEVGEEILQLGALTDSVKEVVEIFPEQIEPPPRLGIRLNTEFIKGVAKQNEEFVIILDIDRVLSAEDLEMVEASADPAAAGMMEKKGNQSSETDASAATEGLSGSP